MYYFTKVATIMFIVAATLIAFAVAIAIIAAVLHFVFGVQLPIAL